jgi:glutamine amidotransferase
MCRILGYAGAPIEARDLIDRPAHSLERQSWAARELNDAVVSADGWGFGFYLDGDPEACLYRSILPIWGDVNRTHLGRAIRSRCILASVRSATNPLSISHANTPPFAAGPLLFVHNGYIEHFAPRVLRKLRSSLSDERYGQLSGETDSEHVFALIADAYSVQTKEPGDSRLSDAVRAAVATVAKLARDAESSALLTLIVSDGSELVALRSSVGKEPPSLYVRMPSSEFHGYVFASEPLDGADSWQRVVPEQMLIAKGTELRRSAL